MYKGHKMKEHLARAAYGEDAAAVVAIIAILKGAVSSEVIAPPLNVGKGRIFKNFLSIGSISSVTERN